MFQLHLPVVVSPEEKPMFPMEPNGIMMTSESMQSVSQSTDLEKSFEVGSLKLGVRIFNYLGYTLVKMCATVYKPAMPKYVM